MADIVEMIWLRGLLLFTSLLAGCAYAPPAGDGSCCVAPPPGTVTVHTNGKVLGGITYWR